MMKRITISLDDDLYRVVKAHAISRDLSLSKAVVELLLKAVEGNRRSVRSNVSEEPSPYRYLDKRTGILVSRGDGTITEDAVKIAEEEEDENNWRAE